MRISLLPSASPMGSRHGQGPAGMITNVWWDSPAFKAGHHSKYGNHLRE